VAGDTLDVNRTVEAPEVMRAGLRYAARLTELGLDPTMLAPDERGTLTDRSLAPADSGLLRLRLPVLQTRDEAHGEADVRLAGLLGEGGMGVVLSAQQVALGREVAVKIPRSGGDGAVDRELLREALVTGRLEHPNIVPIHLLGRTPEGAPLFVMKRIEGVPWSEVLREPKRAPAARRSGHDPLELHLDVLLEVCDALSFAHSRGILHRDLKPQNVMIGSYGEVYVLDWGIAVSLAPDGVLPHVAEVRSVAGTPAYMAPEMAGARADQLGVRTDVYLLGAILHEIVTGQPPHACSSLMATLQHAFDAPPPDYGPEVPAELARICRRALAREPDDRFGDVAELRRALVDFRRHRASASLSTEAARRLEALRSAAALSSGPDSPPSEHAREVTVRAIFAECRFGFQQALADWPESPEALAGRAELYELMIDYELERGRAASAKALLAELPGERPELVARIEEALAREEAERRRVLELESLSRDVDFTVASNARATGVAGLGAIWSLAAFTVAWLERRGHMVFGYEHAVAATTVYALMSTGIGAWIAKTVRLNRVQRRVTLMSVLVSWGFLDHWLSGLGHGRRARLRARLVSPMDRGRLDPDGHLVRPQDDPHGRGARRRGRRGLPLAEPPHRRLRRGRALGVWLRGLGVARAP
jgi:serine/threonine protein kinase